MGNIIEPAGKYPHNPLVGPRPMAWPYTAGARLAQFPFVYYWRYTLWFRPLIFSMITVEAINYPITKFVNRPANVEEWRIRRNGWYARKIDPEDAYF